MLILTISLIIFLLLSYLAILMFQSLNFLTLPKVERNYKIGYSVFSKSIMGGASYSLSYSQNTNFDYIVNVFSKHLRTVLPESEAVLIEYKDMTDLDILENNKVSKYWVRFSLQPHKTESEDDTLDLSDDSLDDQSFDSAEDSEDDEDPDKMLEEDNEHSQDLEDSEDSEESEDSEDSRKEQEKYYTKRVFPSFMKEGEGYFFVYYTNSEKDYYILVNKAIANALDEINCHECKIQEPELSDEYPSDDDD